MSFRGTFPEIDGISADNFTQENLNSSLFFLSHIHTDHMMGLESADFEEKLKLPETYVYSSRISTIFLENKMPKYADKFIYLEINREKMLEIPGSNSVLVVKAIPAEHCPGSVMFLFKYRGKVIVYTGDFRYELDVLEKYRKYFTKEKVDKVYLDVTFFRKDYAMFPSRELVLENMCEHIRAWLESSEKNTILISMPANYGCEFLFKGISDKLKIPVNVSERIYETIKWISDLKMAVTLEPSRIRSEYKGNTPDQWPEDGVKIMFPSARYWINWDGETIFEDNILSSRYCYSCHASYEEVCAFLKMVKPKQIEPNVLPRDDEEQVILEELIEKCLMEISTESSEEIEDVKDGDRNTKKRRTC